MKVFTIFGLCCAFAVAHPLADQEQQQELENRRRIQSISVKVFDDDNDDTSERHSKYDAELDRFEKESRQRQRDRREREKDGIYDSLGEDRQYQKISKKKIKTTNTNNDFSDRYSKVKVNSKEKHVNLNKKQVDNYGRNENEVEIKLNKHTKTYDDQVGNRNEQIETFKNQREKLNNRETQEDQQIKLKVQLNGQDVYQQNDDKHTSLDDITYYDSRPDYEQRGKSNKQRDRYDYDHRNNEVYINQNEHVNDPYNGKQGYDQNGISNRYRNDKLDDQREKYYKENAETETNVLSSLTNKLDRLSRANSNGELRVVYKPYLETSADTSVYNLGALEFKYYAPTSSDIQLSGGPSFPRPKDNTNLYTKESLNTVHHTRSPQREETSNLNTKV